MITREKIDLLMEIMSRTSTQAQKALAPMLESLLYAGADLEQARDELIALTAMVAETYGLASAEGAAQWYQLLRESEKISGAFATEIAGVPALEQVDRSVRYAIGLAFEDNFVGSRKAIEEALEKMVKGAARQTISHNARLDPAKPAWARVPAGSETCAFCDMLASRGFRYSTEKAAKGTGQYHHNCDCVVVPKWGASKVQISGYDPGKLKARYQAAVDSLKEELGDSASLDQRMIVGRMRSLDPERYGAKPAEK